MPHKPPSWWYSTTTSSLLPSLLLTPLGELYGLGVRFRWAITKPYRSKLPVICVGNFTVGGGGKTPTALFIAELLVKSGERPVFLTRGYGGRIKGPHLISTTDTAEAVGDEPLLLSQIAPCIVSADRPAGARFIQTLEDIKPTVIIMDDGFQNPTLFKDLNIMVVDANTAFGNGFIFPAGPLRASFQFQEKKSDLIVLIHQQVPYQFRLKTTQPLFHTVLRPENETANLENKRVIAYCGIAQPEKFWNTLKNLKADIVSKYSFYDHHFYTQQEAKILLKQAELLDAQLVTTEKDWVRLSDNDAPFRDLKRQSQVIKVKLRFSSKDETSFAKHISSVLQ